MSPPKDGRDPLLPWPLARREQELLPRLVAHAAHPRQPARRSRGSTAGNHSQWGNSSRALSTSLRQYTPRATSYRSKAQWEYASSWAWKRDCPCVFKASRKPAPTAVLGNKLQPHSSVARQNADFGARLIRSLQTIPPSGLPTLSLPPGLVLGPEASNHFPVYSKFYPVTNESLGNSVLHVIHQDLRWHPGLSLGLPLLLSCPTLVPIPPCHHRSYFQPTPPAGHREGYLLQQ